MTSSTITIEAPYYGFEGIGHGGYTAGRLAEHLDGQVEVKFVAPPPMEVPLDIEDRDGVLTLLADEQVIAEARPANLNIDIPTFPSLADARLSTEAYRNIARHPSPMCMTCGPERQFGEGLRVFAGHIPGAPVAAALWEPHPNFADAEGFVKKEFVWAALDCPTYWGIRAATADPGRIVTARLTAHLIHPVSQDERAVVTGWPIAERGRLLRGGAAIVSAEGEPLAIAEATWIRSE